MVHIFMLVLSLKPQKCELKCVPHVQHDFFPLLTNHVTVYCFGDFVHVAVLDFDDKENGKKCGYGRVAHV